MPLTVDEVGLVISRCMDEISEYFIPSARITVLIRQPTLRDGNMIVTDDTLEAVLAAIQKGIDADRSSTPEQDTGPG